MDYKILATGSTGNCVIINNEIAIDMGIPYKTLEKSGYIKGLKLVLLTHVHGDHFNPATVRRLHQERPALRWGCPKWMVSHILKSGVKATLIDIISPTEPGETTRALIYNGVTIVSSFPLIHDVPNCGWKIHHRNESLFYATDTGTLDHIEAKDYDFYLIEANHTKAEIEERISEKQARGEFAYELRAARNHLSREQAEEWLARNAGPNSRYVFLHGHKDKEGDIVER